MDVECVDMESPLGFAEGMLSREYVLWREVATVPWAT